MFWELTWTVHFTVCSCHVTYVFQSESRLYSCLNVKKPLLEAGVKSEVYMTTTRIWSSDYNLVKWLSVCLQTKWFWVWVQLQSLNLLFTFTLNSLLLSWDFHKKMIIKLSFSLSVLGQHQYYFYLDCKSTQATIWFFINLFPHKKLPWVYFPKTGVYMGYPP